MRRENVELRQRLTPSLRRRLLRYGALVVFILLSLALGRWIGGTEANRPARPIPVPLKQDTAIPQPGAMRLPGGARQ